MKKVLTVLLITILAFSMFVSCNKGSSSAEPAKEAGKAKAAKTYKIAVATIFEGESWEIQKTYYEKELASALNMNFMFSEKLSDANGLVDFIERAYASGCEGVISFVTSNDAVAQGARKCEEYGMYFITQNSALNKDVANLPHNLGHCGASATGMGKAYEAAFEKLLSDGQNHSLFIFSGAAVGGAIGQGAASHYYSVQGMLEAMQKVYGLKYSKSIDDIINNQNPGEIETGNSNIHIYIYPGYDASAAAKAAQTQFQTGKYDTFAAVFSFSAFSNVIADCEKSLGKNIKVIGTASIEAQTTTGFTSKDQFGDSVLSAAVINPLNNANAICAAIMYNALTGHADAMKDNGKAILFKVDPWACSSAEVYAGIQKLDQSHETYVVNADDIAKLLCEKDSSVTWKTMEAKLIELGDIDAIIAAKL